MEQIVLHTRQRKLLSILSEQKGIITGAELGQKIEVSDRTIRNDILELNRVLKKINVNIESIRGKGYLLNVKDSSILHKLIYTEDSLLTQEDRVRYLVIRLIRLNEDINIGELEDEMFVSRTTLEKDMRVVDERYSKKMPYLKLNRKENAIFFEDNEEKKRVVLNELFSKEWDYNSEEGMNFRDSLFDPKVFDIISVNIKEFLKKYEIKLNDVGLVYFVFTVVIASLRIEEGHSLLVEVQEKNNNPSVTKGIYELADKLEKVLNVSFNKFERDYFAFILMLKRIPNYNDINRNNIAEYVDFKYIKIVESLIDQVKKEYLLDFTKDDELFIGLVLHIQTLVGKLRCEYELKSTVLDMLKNKYPLSFEMSLIFINYFKSMFNIEIQENELSYIAAHLGAATRRLVDNMSTSEIIVAVINHLNYSSFQLLKTKFQSIYGKIIKIVGPFSVYEKEEIAASDATFVLSTVKIKDFQLNGKKEIVVSPFLENEDLLLINKCLDEIKRDFIHPKLPLGIKEYFNEEIFHYGLDIDSKEKVITFLAQELLKKEYVESEFLESVLERENISSTAFESGIAIPHPISNCCNKTIISVAILKKPIIWQGQKVRCVLLLSIREEDKKYLVRFFDLVVNTLGNRSNIKNIMELDKLDKFISIID